MKTINTSRGVALVEVVFGIVIISIVLLSLVGAYNSYLKNAYRVTEQVQAAFLLEEGLEGLRVIRDSGWATSFAVLVPEMTYYLSFDGATWIATTTATTTGSFTRSFRVTPIARDNNDEIVTSGGNDDPNTKKATVSVSWVGTHGTSTLESATYFTKLF